MKIILACFACLIAPSMAQSQSWDIAISEIQYNADSSWESQDWVELYNYGTDIIDLSGWLLKTENVLDEFTIPNGTNIQPGQYKVIAESLDTFAMIYPSVSNVIGSFAFGLDNGGGMVRLFDDSGIPVHQITYADTLPWPVAADGYGPTLEVVDPTENLNDPENWFAGCVGGSPGAAYSDCNYAIQVNELNYNSIFYHDSGDWLELVNSSNAAVDISDWHIRDSKDNNIFNIPAGQVLEPDERLVIATNIFQYTTYYEAIDNLIGDLGWGFSGQGDALRIYDNSWKLQYALYFHDDEPWPDEADGSGFTMELIDFFGTPNVPGAWTPGCIYGSPGTGIILPCPTAIEAYTALPFTYGPNPFTSQILFDLGSFGISEQPLVTIIDLQGRIVTALPSQGTHVIWDGQDLQGNQCPAGLYLVVLQSDTQHWSAVITKQ